MERISKERLEQLISSHAMWAACNTTVEGKAYHTDDENALRELLAYRESGALEALRIARHGLEAAGMGCPSVIAAIAKLEALNA